MVVVLKTQVIEAASSIRFINKLGGLNLTSFRCPNDADDEEDSTMQRNYAIVHMKLLQFFELTLTSTLLHQLLMLIIDQMARPTCHPGRDACDDDQFIVVDQSTASFSCEDDDQCCHHRYAKIKVSSSRAKRVQLPHQCPYIPCPICHQGRNSRAGRFEDCDSSADDNFNNTNIIKCAVISPVASLDLRDVHYSEFYTKKVITGSRTKNNQLPAAITSSPDGGRHGCLYIPYPVCHPGRYPSCEGKSHEDCDSSSVDNILNNNASIECEVKAPVECPDPHVCKEFPCKECHRVRCSPTVQLRKVSGLITSQAPTTCPDGGRHRCTYFPCPICHPGR